MCGIAGVIGRPVISETVVRGMLRAMSHRGPDGSGVWSEQISDGRTVALGHRRLAILDLSDAGAQPMADTSGRFLLTHNGEIYNFLEVRTELQGLGVAFRSQSDTEVIIEAYKQWGTECLSRFNGMFAFALYDRVEGMVFCARDRYGEKPLLFACMNDGFAFASEYKGLLQHPQLSLDIDEWRLLRAAQNASTGLDADRQTVFNDVQQLLPGEAMQIDVRTLAHRIWTYWRVTPGEMREQADEQEVFAEFRDLLIDSVRLRLRSDVPVGSCLSGGLDSSAIVCIVRHLLGPDAPYNTFTGRFPGTAADEWQYAEQVIKATGVVSHTVEPSVDRFLDDLPQFIWLNELPVGSSSQFAQWCVFDLARQTGVTVLLDGQGADEALGGYEQYFAPYVDSLRERGEDDRLARELPLIRERYPHALTPAARGMRDKLPFGVRHWLSNHLDTGTDMRYGMSLDRAHRVTTDNALQRRKEFHPLGSALVQESFGRFLTTLLRYGDRNSMAHSREVRLPFCDHRLAEFVFRLPPHLLMGDVQTKRLLRESMRGILPEGIRTRWNKQGFRPPQELWFESPAFLACVRETVMAACGRSDSPWLASWWSSALDRVRSGQASLGWVLWQPFIIEQWRRHFLQPLAETRARWGDAA
ncbi:MAG: asparagine synthase (glutamine-hydrolyzing) [Vicinamibacterales bacterium]